MVIFLRTHTVLPFSGILAYSIFSWVCGVNSDPGTDADFRSRDFDDDVPPTVEASEANDDEISKTIPIYSSYPVSPLYSKLSPRLKDIIEIWLSHKLVHHEHVTGMFSLCVQTPVSHPIL